MVRQRRLGATRQSSTLPAGHILNFSASLLLTLSSVSSSNLLNLLPTPSLPYCKAPRRPLVTVGWTFEDSLHPLSSYSPHSLSVSRPVPPPSALP